MDSPRRPFDDPDDIPTTAVAKRPPRPRKVDKDEWGDPKADPGQPTESKGDVADPKRGSIADDDD